jgi:signal transduction histidine kinase
VHWVPDVAVGVLVLGAGLLEATTTTVLLAASRPGLAFVALCTALAVGLSRHRPGAALAVVSLVGAAQALGWAPLLLTQLTIVAVAFGAARWGALATVWLSAALIPVAAALGVLAIGAGGLVALLDTAGLKRIVDDAYGLGGRWQIVAAVVAMALLGVPWLAGLALRLAVRARVSRAAQAVAEANAARAGRESQQAQEIARLREEQARLARDVHDVVGHSLAVILAQAESAQFLPDDEPGRLKVTMENIATSARSSLQDVRHVLQATPPGAQPAELERLVEGVRASGHEVSSTVVGTPQPLPPELEQVAFRVLQEMLTNAIRHGRRGTPVNVERHWPDGSWQHDLRIEVRNFVDAMESEDARAPTRSAGDRSSGQGLDGMRRRLESVGGRLDVRRREEPAGATFTSTAWVPVRAAG